MAWKFPFMRLNMRSPSLSMVPQWLEMVIGLNRALGILLCLGENESSDGPIWNLAPNEILRSKVTSPFSALPTQRMWPTHERETSWLSNEQSGSWSRPYPHLLPPFTHWKSVENCKTYIDRQIYTHISRSLSWQKCRKSINIYKCSQIFTVHIYRSM